MSGNTPNSDRCRRDVLKTTAKTAAGVGALATAGAGGAAAATCVITNSDAYVRHKYCTVKDVAPEGTYGKAYWDYTTTCDGETYVYVYWYSDAVDPGWVHPDNLSDC